MLTGKIARILPLFLLLLVACGISASADGKMVLPAKLTSIKEEAFAGDTSISSVVVPEGTTSIGARAFANSGLTSITLPNSLKAIADDAFVGCTGLTAIVPQGSFAQEWCVDNGVACITPAPATDFSYAIENGTVTINSYLGSAYSVVVPDTIDGLPVTVIGRDAFYSNRYLKKVHLPDTVKTLDAYAFSYCSKLSEINFPESLTTIGSMTFFSCSALTEADLPKGVIRIDSNAFASCTALESISLPSAIRSIGYGAFSNCDNLTATVKEYSYAHTWCKEQGIAVKVVPGDYIFRTGGTGVTITAYTGSDAYVAVPTALNGLPVVEIAANAFNGNPALNEIVLPDTVTAIGSRAFEGCAGLKSIHLPEALTQIGERCFSECTALPEIMLPDSLAQIGERCFSGCTALPEITLPDTLVALGKDAFAGCKNLSAVYASAGKYSATAISLQGIAFTDAQDETMRFFQHASANGSLSLQVAKYLGTAEELTLPETFAGIPITSIGKGAFENCSTLKKVLLSDKMQTIGDRAFANSGLKLLWLPAGISSISDNAFSGCSGLLLRAIDGSYGAKWCASSGIDYYLDTTPNDAGDFTVSNLTSTTCSITGYTGERTDIVFPKTINGRTVTTIAMHTFMNNLSVTSVNIPGTITTISDYAFYGCHNLSKVILNDGIKTVGPFAFYGCSFEEIVFPDSVTTLQSGLGANSKLSRVVLPSKLTTIPSQMFSRLSALKNISIPSTVKTIGNYAFQGAGLTSITLPSGLKTIGQLAFYNCFDLKTAYVPSSVTSIGDEAFIKTTEIHCPKGSTADKWAVKNGIPVVYE